MKELNTEMIDIHAELVSVLKERFREKFGVPIDEASKSTFSEEKVTLFTKKLGSVEQIKLPTDITSEALRKKFKRALLEFKIGSTGGFSIDQYDQVCYFLLDRKTEECTLMYSNGEIVRKIRSLKEARRTGGKQSVRKKVVGIPLKNIPLNKDFKSEAGLEGFTYIDYNFWKKLKSVDTKSRIEILNRYYTHIDSKLIAKAVANEGFIVEPEEMLSITDDEENKEAKPFKQALDIAISDSFSLIKILGEGGIGKSTFLYWIAKQYYEGHNIFIIEKFYPTTIDKILAICCNILVANPKPVLLLIDDVAEYEKSKQAIDCIIKTKESLNQVPSVVFIVAERKIRYNLQLGPKKLDVHFSGCVQTLDYTPANKQQIFTKIYSILLETNLQLEEEELRKNAESIFLDEKIYSVSESIFRLLNHLKIKRTIRYEFDWDDWDTFIKENPEYQSLENLFIAVACFYQFGIKLPITFKCPALKDANRVNIRKAINLFGLDESPIKITDDGQDKDTKLFLKHEYIATWFLYDEKRRQVIIDFFKDFLSSITTKEAGWLLRQLRKSFKTPEYVNSGFSKFLDENKYFELITEFLNSDNISENEKIKMRMERGLLLSQRGNDVLSQSIFQSIANDNPLNNHARDQLAKIYQKSPSSYQLAFNKYLEIFNNGGLYAFTHLYKLLRLCKAEQISINYENNSDFTDTSILAVADKLSPYNYHELIKELLLQEELKSAEMLLLKVKKVQSVTAECYNTLANSIKYSNENIELKEKYYRKAIEIYKSFNSDRENFSFVIDYALFLYRTRRFPESLDIIKNLVYRVDEAFKSVIENRYWNCVRNTKKLFFRNVPNRENLIELKAYLLKQCKWAAALISFKQKNIDNIIKGYLILQTVKFHSKVFLPEVFNNASKLMAYCYMQNADRQWNNLSSRENRLISEKLYDQLIAQDYFLEKNDCANMLKNLLNFKEIEKSSKALHLISEILDITENKQFAIFFRYRANAKKDLKDYNGAMVDYQTALSRCKPNFYDKPKDYNNDRGYLLNNIALLICECIEVRKPFKKYGLDDALVYCNESIKLLPDWMLVKETKRKVEDLMQKSFE